MLFLVLDTHDLNYDITFAANPQKSESVECSTASDSPNNPNTPCILPFKVAGELQKQCSLDINTGHFWCPTKVNDDGEYIFGQGHWGFCSPSCSPYNQTNLSVIKASSKKGTMFSTKDAWRGTVPRL